MQYADYEGLCSMVGSDDYMSVYKYKVTGLLDTHTYLAQQIL